MFVQLKELQFKKDILAFYNDILLHEIFIADKLTQDNDETLNTDTLDVILYIVPVEFILPVDVISVQFIPTDVVLLLYTLFLTYPSEGASVS